MSDRFRDRRDAGRHLASELIAYGYRRDVVVLALAPGGVPVAFEVALKLGAPLDVVVVRKLLYPGPPELAIGAIASGGARVIDQGIVRGLGIQPSAVETIAAREQAEVQRCERLYRGDRAPARISAQTVILVDDGLAMGATMLAATKAVRQRDPARVVVAVPVASPGACALLSRQADRCLCLRVTPELRSIAAWYEDFAPISETEVQALLARAAREPLVTATVG